MPAFPKPKFTHPYQVQPEIKALNDYRRTKPNRQIPQKTGNRLLLATWNIANLGLQKRRDKDYRLIAEMMSWFDIIAVQEVNDNLSGFRSILGQLRQHYRPADYRAVFSDRAGNNERMAFVYDANKLDLLEMVGEVAVPPKDHKHIKLPGIDRKFSGFDRNPYLAAFKSGNFSFTLVNVHLYYGKDTTADRKRRSLETYAVGRWADLRRNSANAYTTDVIALGDFNMPKAEKGDPIYKALVKRGLRLPEHTSQIGSNIANDKDYDQIAFFPGRTKKKFTGKTNIFDFDGALFASLYKKRTKAQFRSYVRYYISDHRILWAQFKTA
jgi:endonuclease/exonuclease/phosphatase family metal-dependent hydrolase